MSEHAKLSCSGSSRWLVCTPSAVLEEGYPDKSSEAAEEGTLAHRLIEILVQKFFKQIDEAKYTTELLSIHSHPMYNNSMLLHTGNYRDYIIEQYHDALSETKKAFVLTEMRVDVSEFIREGFGHVDTTIVGKKTVWITDLKYGKGVKVDAVDNTQLRLYALGTIAFLREVYDLQPEWIVMTIYQPRIDNIVEHKVRVSELLQWGEEYVKPRAELAFKGEGVQVVGSHCKFCRAIPKCAAMKAHNMKLAKYEFAPAYEIPDEEVNEILDLIETLIPWANAVKDYAFAEALKGKKWPKRKLVRGRSNRVITDEEAVKNILDALGYAEDEIYNKKLFGVTDLESLLGKQVFKDALGHVVDKPLGSPTLVSSTDPRPEYRSAAEEFTND